MKTLKFYLIFIAFLATCASNLCAMDEKMVANSDEKTGIPSLDITTINQQLANIKINGGFLSLQARDPIIFKGFGVQRRIRFMFAKKAHEEIEIGFADCVITDGTLGSITIDLRIDNKKYRKRKLATIMTLASLQQAVKDSGKNNSRIVAAHEATHKIFKGIGFKPTENNKDILETDCLPKLLTQNGPRMMQTALETFEQSTHCCCCSLFKLLCSTKSDAVVA